MQNRFALTIPLLALAAGCEGTFLVDPADPRLDLTVATARTDLTSPLIYLDGIRISKAELLELDRNRIASIEVVKGAAATSLHGAAGREGIIYVSLKK